MQKYLNAISRAETFMLYDPSSISEDDLAIKSPDDTILNIANNGHAFAYSDSKDKLDVLLFIDEEPDQNLITKNSACIHNACLKTPSGHLVISGMDELMQLNEEESKPKRKSDTEFDLPAGTYRVDAYELDWEKDKFEDKESVLEKVVATSMSCVLFSTCFILPAAFLAVWMEVSLSSAIDLLYIAILFEVVFWPTAFIISSLQKTYLTVKRDLCPKVVIQLTSLQTMPQDYNSAILGCGLDHLKEKCDSEVY